MMVSIKIVVIMIHIS